jgi:hypothetical protein
MMGLPSSLVLANCDKISTPPSCNLIIGVGEMDTPIEYSSLVCHLLLAIGFDTESTVWDDDLIEE